VSINDHSKSFDIFPRPFPDVSKCTVVDSESLKVFGAKKFPYIFEILTGFDFLWNNQLLPAYMTICSQ